MAGERGSVKISEVKAGHRVELVCMGDIYHETSGVIAIVTAQTEEGIQARLISPRSLIGNAHLRITFRDSSTRVFDWGKQVVDSGGIRNLPTRMPRVGGYVLPPTTSR